MYPKVILERGRTPRKSKRGPFGSCLDRKKNHEVGPLLEAASIFKQRRLLRTSLFLKTKTLSSRKTLEGP